MCFKALDILGLKISGSNDLFSLFAKTKYTVIVLLRTTETTASVLEYLFHIYPENFAITLPLNKGRIYEIKIRVCSTIGPRFNPALSGTYLKTELVDTHWPTALPLYMPPSISRLSK
jgi:hypothetical protein